jgi:hypothetical protein
MDPLLGEWVQHKRTRACLYILKVLTEDDRALIVSSIDCSGYRIVHRQYYAVMKIISLSFR